MRKIEWSPDAVNSLNEILEYYMGRAGENTANNIYNKIMKDIELLEVEEVRTKRTQELKDIGINDVYELVISPWKVYYKIKEDNQKAYILFVLDGRRNIEEILIAKIVGIKI
ncbi:MAG: type II toxin-antitoxin system RelE/ParE family toxin [Spirochaetaceae bacterium]|jgi:plasmid stabilization system protein ParE|nr:type II toxin-antitoxin system RelE/ParE family toxin [Spirochaetaceae bacterium]